MKKFYKAVIFVLMISFICSGCRISKTEKINTHTANLLTDNNITNSEELDKSKAKGIFTEAFTAAIKNQNITINMNFKSSYGDEESMINNVELKLDSVDEQQASIKRSYNEDNTEKTQQGYYKDGYYYLDDNGNKQKIAQDYSEFLINNENYIMDINDEIISGFAVRDTDKGKIYYIQYDPEGYKNQISGILANSDQPLTEDEEIAVKYSNVVFEVDENNVMKYYTFITDSGHKSKEGENEYVFDINVEFKDINKTRVDVLDNLDLYKDVTNSQSDLTDIPVA